MMRLVIGCPIRDRAWIMPAWFDSVRTAVDRCDVDVEFIFVGDPSTDPTFRLVNAACKFHGFSRMVMELDEIYEPYKRVWNIDRYSHMVRLRNTLLRGVRRLEPDLFWSLDSDILVAPDALVSLLDGIQSFDAVGGKIYMTPKGTQCPSYGMLNAHGGLLRPDADGLFSVDVIMATKLMRPKAYNVDYVVDRQGEDIGWSKAARAAGCKLGWDGRVLSAHVMDRDALRAIEAGAS
jgi:hypothetical protein